VSVDLNPRYLDALILLTRHAGRLVTKEQFLEQVLRGVPVTDEALTQCIKTLRRQLGDDAARPRFVETVPKHGYRFIAPVELQTADFPRERVRASLDWRRALLLGGAGTVGAGFAGLVGGLVYGVVGASYPFAPGMGGASVLLVLIWLCLGVALIGGAGVSFGIGLATLAPARRLLPLGGAMGGLAVGGAVNLLGTDAFNLLLGQSPGDVTGAAEGALIGLAVGLGAYWERRDDERSVRRSAALAGLAGGAAGAIIPLLGGQMLSGSLDALAATFPQSRFQLDQLGLLIGESDFGTASRVLSGWLEGALFASCIIVAIGFARRRWPAGE
jgi:hypothetical protein